MSDTTYALFFPRTSGVNTTPRGAAIPCHSAIGNEVVSQVGTGKVVIHIYQDSSRTTLERVQSGDLCIVYTVAPMWRNTRTATTWYPPLHVTSFIVDSRSYKDGRYEISGRDYIGALMDYPALTNIGQLTEIVVTALSLGDRLNRDPEPDVWVPLEAAYAPRSYSVANFTGATTTDGTPQRNILFSTWMTVQVTDQVWIYDSDGTIFKTTVTGVSDERRRIQIADGLEFDLDAGVACYFFSKRMKVSDASDLTPGDAVYYRPSDVVSGDPSNYSLIVDTIEETDAGDYIYFADPIPHNIAAGASLTQYQYAAATTGDVALLLSANTLGRWSVDRSPSATIGTVYKPNGESVWDALLAIADMSGYQFRRRFRGFSNKAQGLYAWSDYLPENVIEYFPAGSPITSDYPYHPARVVTLGTENRVAENYGEILSLQTEDTNAVLTHLVPYGGGGGAGRFDFRMADIITVMSDYPELNWGILYGQYYIYHIANAQALAPTWASHTFSHISPINPSDIEDRREAASALLRAACEWLMKYSENDVTYVAEVFTIGEPRVGDKVNLNYTNVEIHDITETDLVIAACQHEITPERGYRTTTLTMNKKGFVRFSGENAMARSILDLQRNMRHANFGSYGDYRIGYDGMEFGTDANVTSQTGNIGLQSRAGNVTIVAEAGDVYIAGREIELSGSVVAPSVTVDRIYLEDEAQPVKWDMTAFTLRNIPRARLERVAIETGG